MFGVATPWDPGIARWEWPAPPVTCAKPPCLLTARFGRGAPEATVAWMSQGAQDTWHS